MHIIKMDDLINFREHPFSSLCILVIVFFTVIAVLDGNYEKAFVNLLFIYILHTVFRRESGKDSKKGICESPYIWDIKHYFQRIKWGLVIGILLFVIVIGFLITQIPKGYSVQGDVGLEVSADPSTIKIGERTKIEIEIKNMNKEREVTVYVEAKTYDDQFLFAHTGNRYASKRDVVIGPKMSRQFSFEVKPLPDAIEGKYRIDVTARERSYTKGAEDIVYVKVIRE